METTETIRFPCAVCTKLIPDWRVNSFDIGFIDLEIEKGIYPTTLRLIYYHKKCAKGLSKKEILFYAGITIIPIDKKPPDVILEKEKDTSLTDAALQSQPDKDQKDYDLRDIIIALQERPKCRKQLFLDTEIDKTTIYWRIWDNDADTPKISKKGKIQRLSETFIRVGNRAGKIRGAVYALNDKEFKYPEEILQKCVRKHQITFFKWFHK